MKTGRRTVLLGGLAVMALPPRLAAAATDHPAILALLKGRTAQAGRLHLELPPLAENGNAVPLGVTVDCPLRGAGRLAALHVIAPANPTPQVVTVRFGASAVAPAFQTRVRLADSQTVTALAELADGTMLRGDAEVIITIAACVDTD